MVAVDGLDTSVGLACVFGRHVRYLRLLIQYRDRERSFSDRCRLALSLGKPELARRAATELRTASAALGALAIARQVVWLEAALDNAAEPEELLVRVAQVDALLGPLIEALDEQLVSRPMELA